MKADFTWLWFANDGGPLLVIPREATMYWEGAEPPSDGRIIEAGFFHTCDVATDYDRACDLETLPDVLDVGSSWALVLDEDIPVAAWMKSPHEDAFFVVRVVYSNVDGNEHILEAYADRQEDDWKRIASNLLVEQGDLILMHAASVFDETLNIKQANDIGLATIGDAIVYQANPGIYSMDVCEVECPGKAHFTFYRFVRAI